MYPKTTLVERNVKAQNTIHYYGKSNSIGRMLGLLVSVENNLTFWCVSGAAGTASTVPLFSWHCLSYRIFFVIHEFSDSNIVIWFTLTTFWKLVQFYLFSNFHCNNEVISPYHFLKDSAASVCAPFGEGNRAGGPISY